ncbi:MAG: 3,4-dihydroxy-2-butanone-4-phosphate synthase [candidate division Zixibacteria bacterium]|nr:3,4-dihydroxy-2-butanone-4-phosphate synthase [candidate division Zixibacteria bacterium]
MKFNAIPEVLEELKAGRMIIVTDDEGRENEGDLVFAAEAADWQKVEFMIRQGGGLVCVSMPQERLHQLNLPPMASENSARLGTAFTVSVDAKEGTTTGISARERAATIRALVNSKTQPDSLARPGHVFPIRSEDGGVLSRPGHTEAGVDLCRLAGLYPAAVLCEITDTGGGMARGEKLFEFAKKWDLKIVTIQDLIRHRLAAEKLVERQATVRFPTRFGDFTLYLYWSEVDRKHHLVLEKGKVSGRKDILVRVHSQCTTGDLFGSLRCDCGDQLGWSLREMEKAGEGLFIYLLQEGRGIGLANKILAYKLQDGGKDTVEANLELGFQPDLRNYGTAAQILREFGLSDIHLITNNPKKIQELEELDIKVKKRVKAEIVPTEHNRSYLKTKQTKLGHLLDSLV